MEAHGVALVTGASRGIGRAVALELAQRGFDVVAGMRNVDDGTSLAAEFGEGPGSIRVSRLDVTESATMTIPAGLRVLVNNAGTEREYLPVEHAVLGDWRDLFETNFFGLVELTSRAIPELRRGGGVICNVTSSGLLFPMPFYGGYRASKAAVAAMSESLAAELAPFGIRVLEVLPGPIATDMLAASNRLPEGARFPGYEQLANEALEGRRAVEPMVTSPEDAARAIVDGILDDGSTFRLACDPLGKTLLKGWRANPAQFMP